MRKLSLAIAAVLAGTMIFGATVFAAGSSTTTTTTAPVETVTAAHSYAANVTAGGAIIDGQASNATVSISPVSVAEVNEANAQCAKLVAPTAQVLQMFNVDLYGISFGKAQITLNVPGIVAGQDVTVLHKCDNGTWEVIKPDAVGNGTVTATFTSLSPVAIVAGSVSAKTADVAPYGVIMVMVCALGAAVCAKKAFN